MTEQSDNERDDVASLIERCKSGDDEGIISVIESLESMNAREAVPAILPLLATGDEFVRSAAAEALGSLGDDAIDEVGPALVRALSDPADMVRNSAAEAFCSLRYTPARPALERVLLHDRSWAARASAAEALGQLGDPRALDALEVALRQGVPYPVRAYAAAAIGQLGDKNRLPAIRRQLAVEDEPVPRAELIEVALRFGDDSAFDELLAMVWTVDLESAWALFSTIERLLECATPPVVAARAGELADRLADRPEHAAARLSERVARIADTASAAASRRPR